MLLVNKRSIIVFLLLVMTWTSPVNADNKAPVTVDDSIFEAALEKNNPEKAVSILVEKNVPIPLIISKLQNRGFDDDEIVNALLKTKLLREEIVYYVFLSHVSYNKVLTAFEKNGYDKIEIMELLAEGGADKDIFFKTGRFFKISRKTLVGIYQEAKERPAKFGRAVSIQSVNDQPVLMTVGISSITGGDAFVNRPKKRISPCRWVCEWVCE